MLFERLMLLASVYPLQQPRRGCRQRSRRTGAAAGRSSPMPARFRVEQSFVFAVHHLMAARVECQDAIDQRSR
jgi:hypothetical protein